MKASRDSHRIYNRFKQIEAEGGGVWTTEIIFWEDLPNLLSAGLSGDPEAIRRMEYLEQAIQLLDHKPPPLCLLCTHEPHEKGVGAYVLIAAKVDMPTSGVIVNFVCGDCAYDGATLLERIFQYYQKYLFGNGARRLPPFAGRGTA